MLFSRLASLVSSSSFSSFASHVMFYLASLSSSLFSPAIRLHQISISRQCLCGVCPKGSRRRRLLLDIPSCLVWHETRTLRKKKQESQQVVSSRYTPPPLDWLLLLATTSTNFVFLIKNSCPVCSFIHSRLSSQCRFVMQCPSSTTSTVGEKKKATVRDKSHDNPVF